MIETGQGRRSSSPMKGGIRLLRSIAATGVFLTLLAPEAFAQYNSMSMRTGPSINVGPRININPTIRPNIGYDGYDRVRPRPRPGGVAPGAGGRVAGWSSRRSIGDGRASSVVSSTTGVRVAAGTGARIAPRITVRPPGRPTSLTASRDSCGPVKVGGAVMVIVSAVRRVSAARADGLPTPSLGDGATGDPQTRQ